MQRAGFSHLDEGLRSAPAHSREIFPRPDVDREDLARDRRADGGAVQLGLRAADLRLRTGKSGLRRREPRFRQLPPFARGIRLALRADDFGAAHRGGILDLAVEPELPPGRRLGAAGFGDRGAGFGDGGTRLADRSTGLRNPRAQRPCIDHEQRLPLRNIVSGLHAQIGHQTRERRADLDGLARRLDHPRSRYARRTGQLAGCAGRLTGRFLELAVGQAGADEDRRPNQGDHRDHRQALTRKAEILGE